MRGSSSTRRITLTPERLAQLTTHREHWAAARLGTAPGDRAAAETGVRLAYEAAGLVPPGVIEWCPGPLELAGAWHMARGRASGGANVRFALIGHARGRAEAAVRPCLTFSDWSRVIAGARSGTAEAVSAAIDATVVQAARWARPPLVQRLGFLLRTLAQRGWRSHAWPSFERAGFGPGALDWTGPFQFLRECVGLERETEALRGLWLLAANTAWVMPHEHVCWLVERPDVLVTDAQGRLHCANGPALAFRDGWCRHAWKGITVPAHLVEHPDAISIASIDNEQDLLVRRCMIEIMGPARYLALGGARRVAQDETGILWRKEWFSGDAWAAVEVVNGTPEPDGSFRRYVLQVPPEIGTARGAVAWTYGISEQQYARLSVRT